MTTCPTTGRAVAPRTTLLTRALVLRFVSIIGSSVGFYLPLSVVPLLAHRAADAGFATVALLVTTVACELVTPRLVGRIGYRWALALGLGVLGGSSLILAVTDRTWVIVAVSIARGAGFAVAVVAGGAVTATLIPADRRGEGLALVGVVSGVPGILGLPAGVWIATHWGFPPVFLATGAVTLLALLSVPGLPGRPAPSRGRHGVLAGLRNPLLARPAVAFAGSTVAVGVLVTFLPLASGVAHAWVASAALLAQQSASTVARWAAGRVGDRLGAARLLRPGLLLAAAGMAALVAIDSPAAVIGGTLVFGVGFGVLQNASLTLMYARAAAGGEGMVSAIWNAAYDLGMAAGALCAGPLVGMAGYSVTFGVTAAIMLPALALVRRPKLA
ncbi:MAG TPA: MFS transporter [Pseudonocardiaceae bacterium]|nr:MFS transporter [Pseudonocardiaceae bacterium]